MAKLLKLAQKMTAYFDGGARNSNLESLRILSMVLIVMHHYAIHGFVQINLSYSLNKYIVDCLSVGGKLGVDCFILISGFFMVNSRFTVKKLFRLLGEVWFYSIGITILFLTVLTPIMPIDLEGIVKTILPVIYSTYWFVTDYIILMILSPFINEFINIMEKQLHRKLICLLILLWSILPTFLANTMAFSDLGWFITLYFISGYIRKYANGPYNNAKKHFSVAFIFVLILILSVISFNVLGRIVHSDVLLSHSRYFSKQNSVIVLIIAVELFIGALRLKKRAYPYVNIVSSATFGVYLIHDNFYLRPYLWGNILKNAKMYDSQYLIIHACMSIFTVYVMCTLIDLIRQISVERIYLYILDKYLPCIVNKVKTNLCVIGSSILVLVRAFYLEKNGQKE